jgi:hypothetical protein
MKASGQRLLGKRLMRFSDGEWACFLRGCFPGSTITSDLFFDSMKTSSWAFRVIPVTVGLLLVSFQLWSQTISYDVAKGTMGNHAIPNLGNQAMAGLAISNDFERSIHHHLKLTK